MDRREPPFCLPLFITQTKVTKSWYAARGDALPFFLCFASREREREREIKRASHLYHIVTATNATGQQCDRVHIARVRPLIPHVFSHPSRSDTSQLPHPTSLPSNEIWLYIPFWNWISGDRWVFANYSLHLPGTLPHLAFHKIRTVHVKNTKEEYLF